MPRTAVHCDRSRSGKTEYPDSQEKELQLNSSIRGTHRGAVLVRYMRCLL